MEARRIRGKKAKVNFPDTAPTAERRHPGRVVRQAKKSVSLESPKLSNNAYDHVSSSGSSTDVAVLKLELSESVPLPVSSSGLDAFELSLLGGLSYLEAAGEDKTREFDHGTAEADMVFGSGEVRLTNDFAYYEPYANYMQLPYLEGNPYENIDVLFSGETIQDGVNIGGLWSFDDMPMDHSVY